jgi:hypothetical protein
MLTQYYNTYSVWYNWQSATPFYGEFWDPLPRFPAVLTLFNRVGSGVLVRLTKLALDTLADGLPGAPLKWQHALLRGITACTGGTALAAVKMDSGSADPPAGLEVLLYPTASPLTNANRLRQTVVMPSPKSMEYLGTSLGSMGRLGGFSAQGMAFGEILKMRSPSQPLILRPGEGAAWYPNDAGSPPQRYWIEIALSCGGITYCYQTEFDTQAGELRSRLPLVVWNNSASAIQIDRFCLVYEGDDVPTYEVIPVEEVTGGAVVVPVGMDSQMVLPTGVEIRALATAVRGGERVGVKVPHLRAPMQQPIGAPIPGPTMHSPLYGRYGLFPVTMVGMFLGGGFYQGLYKLPAGRHAVDLSSTGAILLREGQGVALVPRKRSVWGGEVRAQMTFTTEYPARPVARAHVGM